MIFKQVLKAFIIVVAVFSNPLQAEICPDPLNSSLQWGEVPLPWIPNPFSPYPVQKGNDTQFSRAVILVVNYGVGVVCFYKTPLTTYSIWWPVPVKVPAPTDYSWIATYVGYVCSDSLASCQFNVAR